MIEHHIQRDILKRLMAAKTVRFSELKPDGMESNAFMYHLKQLMNSGHVMQNDDKTYSLSPDGLSYIDSLSLTNSLPRKQPKLVCIIALRNPDGKYLLAKRLVQPTIDTWMLPSGKQHFGESTEAHVKREVEQQFGHDIDVVHRGMLDIRIMHEGVLVTHLVGQVYSGGYQGELPPDTQKFHFEWHDPAEPITFTPGTQELITALEQDSSQFLLSLDVAAV